MKKSFIIEVSMEERWIPHFLGMLSYMRKLGSVGASRKVTFFSDGDGDFRPDFRWSVDIQPVNDDIPYSGSIGDRFYDAG
jgi:hypothetical protein